MSLHPDFHVEQAKVRRFAEQGRRLQEAREAAALGQAAVAAAARVNPKTVSKWENGWQNPHDNQLRPVADLLGRPVAWFRYGAVPPEEPPPPEPAPADPPLPRVLRRYAVRVWLKEFELELTRAGVPEDRVADALALVTAPQGLVYNAGGGELTEEEAIRAMTGLAEMVRAKERERGHRFDRDVP